MADETDLYFRQLALGEMANLVYLVGSRSTRECVVVDPAWNIDGILEVADEDEMKLVGALVTHYHQDHIGGSIFGMEIDFPGAHDPGLQLTRLFGMLHEKRSRDCGIRKSFVIDPAHQIRMIFEYPLGVGRNSEELLRVIRALQMRAGSGVATPADWYYGDLVIISDGRSEDEVIAEFGSPSVRLTPYLRVVTPRDRDAPDAAQRNAPDILQYALP